MIEQHEFEPVSARVAVATCMDEALTFKKGAIVFGLGGTAVSTPARGNLELFTPEHRKLIDLVRPTIYTSLTKLSRSLDAPLAFTSHRGCGWAKGMGIHPDEVSEVTEKVIENAGLDTRLFAGHIDHHHKPQPIGKDGKLGACIIRPPEEHLHSAESIIITTGGGITPEEKQILENEHGASFIISADYVSRALQFGLKSNYLEQFLNLQIDVAYHIMNNSALNIIIFDAKRLHYDAQNNNSAAEYIQSRYQQ